MGSSNNSPCSGGQRVRELEKLEKDFEESEGDRGKTDTLLLRRCNDFAYSISHTPCYAMLCHAMPCYAMPCYAMLWHAVTRAPTRITCSLVFSMMQSISSLSSAHITSHTSCKRTCQHSTTHQQRTCHQHSMSGRGVTAKTCRADRRGDAILGKHSLCGPPSCGDPRQAPTPSRRRHAWTCCRPPRHWRQPRHS